MSAAKPACSPRVLTILTKKIHQHLGVDFAGERSADLLRRFKLLATEQEVVDLPAWLETQAFAEWDATLIQSLAPFFTVGETYFRRDAEALDWLSTTYFPGLLKRRRLEGLRHIRIWSAACCTGEEAYSLLFQLDELLAADRQNWSLELTASDLNTDSLARAKQALYGENAFRSNESDFRRRYFQPEGRLWQVRPQWRERIRFVQHNLANAPLPNPALGLAGVDLILCRNVLMYFSPERAAATLRRLLSCLTCDGVLLLSAVEAGIATQAGLSGFWAGCNYALGASSLRPPTASAPLPVQQPLLKRTNTALSNAAVTHSPAAVIGTASLGQAALSGAEQSQPSNVAATLTANPAPARVEPEHYWQQAAQAQASGQHPQTQQALLAYLACTGLSQTQKHHACLQMARSWADQQHNNEAEEWLQRALLLDPNSAIAYWLMALLAQQNTQPKAALLALQKALYLDPEFILAHFHQARLLRVEGRVAASNKALLNCRRLLTQQPPETLLPQGDGLSCGQLLRLCEQQLEDHAYV